MNDLKIDISIIIPVFNCETYIFRCIQSIFSQDFSLNIEVIVVDDASTDGSLKILRSLQVNEPRLIVIEHEFNKSLAVARLTGIKAATGYYILHVDADDWLLPGAIEKMYTQCLNRNVDILVFNYIRVTSDFKKTYVDKITKEIISDDKLFLIDHFLSTAWNKLVKRSITTNLVYGQIRLNNTEDLVYAVEILLKAQKVCLTPDYYYMYFQSNESLTKATKPDVFIDSQIKVLEYLKLIFDNYSEASKIKDIVLNRLIKHIYFAVGQSNFIFKSSRLKKVELLSALTFFYERNSLQFKTIERGLSNNYYLLKLVYLNFGFKSFFAFILRYFRGYFLKKYR